MQIDKDEINLELIDICNKVRYTVYTVYNFIYIFLSKNFKNIFLENTFRRFNGKILIWIK